jgi:hypothetical protein
VVRFPSHRKLYDANRSDSIKDKNGEKAIAFLDERRELDKEIVALFRRAQALAAISEADIASGTLFPQAHVFLSSNLIVLSSDSDIDASGSDE